MFLASEASWAYLASKGEVATSNSRVCEARPTEAKAEVATSDSRVCEARPTEAKAEVARSGSGPVRCGGVR